MKHALFAALLMATPVAAQDRMTAAQCNDSWAVLEALNGRAISDAAIMPNNEGWCEITDGVFGIDRATRMQIGSLRWRASDIDRFIEDQLPPRALEIRGQGFGLVPETGDPVYDYLLGIQSARDEAAFGLSVRWDGVQNAVFIDDAFVDFSPNNRIEATARIDGINLTDQTTTQMSLGSMGLRDLSIKSDFAGWFEAYVAFGLGAAVLSSGEVSPDVQVADLQRQAVQFIDGLPDANMSQASRSALSEFIIALPSPRGRVQMQLNAAPPLGAVRMATLAVLPEPPTPEKIVELGLAGVTLLFTWAPTGGSQ